MSVPNEWDPLIGIEETFAPEYLVTLKKIEIKNILKSYTGFYDLFNELMQNSIDALEERIEEDSEGYRPTLWILINLKENYVSVTDNGVGFNPDQFKFFLSPNISFKQGKKLRGNKGVGATYLAYGFNYLQIGTKTHDFEYVGTLENGRNWVEDVTGAILRPKIRKTDVIHEAFKEIDRGSTFTLKLLGDNIRPKDLSWQGVRTADQWEACLKLNTPLGGIYLRGEKLEFDCNLKVIDRDESITEKRVENVEYIYPHNVVSSSVDLRRILEDHRRAMERQRPSRTLDRYRKLDGIHMIWNKDGLLSESFSSVNSDEEKRRMIEEQNVIVYGFFCYSINIWDVYNDETLGIRKGLRILRGGLRISSHNMIQGVYLTIPLRRYIGYQRVTHVIVDYDDVEPDMGRKGFQPEIVELAEAISENVVSIFREWAGNLKEDTGALSQIRKDSVVHDWVQEQIDHERQNPMIITGRGLFLPAEEIPITSLPLIEQDVVALFNQLLSAGVIRGIKIMSTSTHTRYDGLYKIEINAPYDKYIYDRDTNPLGVYKETFAEGDITSPPYIFEYKYNADALFREFETENKSVDDIQLLIAWDMGDQWKYKYEIIPLLHFDYVQHRVIHGTTHIVREVSTGRIAFTAIILSELIRYLQDSDAEQDIQESRYSE